MNRRNWTSLSRYGCYLNTYTAPLVWWEVCRSCHLTVALRRDYNQLLFLRIRHNIHTYNGIIWT